MSFEWILLRERHAHHSNLIIWIWAVHWVGGRISIVTSETSSNVLQLMLRDLIIALLRRNTHPWCDQLAHWLLWNLRLGIRVVLLRHIDQLRIVSASHYLLINTLRHSSCRIGSSTCSLKHLSRLCILTILVSRSSSYHLVLVLVICRDVSLLLLRAACTLVIYCCIGSRLMVVIIKTLSWLLRVLILITACNWSWICLLIILHLVIYLRNSSRPYHHLLWRWYISLLLLLTMKVLRDEIVL